jgi:prepilin-type N-terminal cleavage/methylation domain-containing protein
MRPLMTTRRGFTLPELLIGMTLLLVITGAATQFMRRQTNLITRESGRMDALQNAEFAATQIERELREAGAGVVDNQPMLVQVDSEAITFNANMVSIDTGDVKAVYQLSDADTNGTRVFQKSERAALPNSDPPVSYPDTTYNTRGTPSSAETISYFLRPDSTTTGTTDYLLFRRVNALTPTLVARGIVKDPARDTVPFFTYFITDTLNRRVPIARSRLPLYHGIVHGAASDTGRFALPDSVRVVRIHFLAVSKDPRNPKGDGLRTVETKVRLMNAGLLNRTSCGQPPYPPAPPNVASSALGAATKSVTITWSKATDDGGGEKDIERYAIYRRLTSAVAFGDPITSVPASLVGGATNYTFVDTAVQPGQAYTYGIAAQDCTPAVSAIAASLGVTVNP